MIASVISGARPDAVAAASSRSAELALMSNVALALLLVLGLPRQIPDWRR